jgi:hypothetical protein
MALDLWGKEMVVEAPKKKPRCKEVQPFRRPAYCSENNDIDGWFGENSPQTLAECDDVRKALSKKSQVGNYEASTLYARTGTRLVRVPEREYRLSMPTCTYTYDIESFLRTDGPTGPLELMDLRRAVANRRVIGRYHAFEYPFRHGEKGIRVVCHGPNRALIITRNAASFLIQALEGILVSGEYRQEPERPTPYEADEQ